MMFATSISGNTFTVTRGIEGTTASAHAASAAVAQQKNSSDNEKIVVFDYHKTVADLVGHPPTDNWATYQAPRHFGKCNVLSFGGHVLSRSLSDIDPTLCTAQEDFWRPRLDDKYVYGSNCQTSIPK